MKYLHRLIFSAMVLFVAAWTSMATAQQTGRDLNLEDFHTAGNGFRIFSDDTGENWLRIGGVLQSDYRYYGESQREDNRFDLRRARLYLKGELYGFLGYEFEYEFEGNEAKNLLDGYGEIGFFSDHRLRFGQFKTPFGLEWSTQDKNLLFAERSMGYYLTPRRDIGVMAAGQFFDGLIQYAAGLFNGDGPDGSSSGTQSDSPEIVGRLLLSPFANMKTPLWDHLHIGGSVSHAEIDLANIDLAVKSTGMVETNQSLYQLKHNTKFGVLYDTDQRQRTSLEAAWSMGQFAVQGEYFEMEYSGLKPASGPARDAEFTAGYLSALWCVTGEPLRYENGVFCPIEPAQPFDPKGTGWGALALALRYEKFEGDEDWIVKDAQVSAAEAEAYSLALNWVLRTELRLIADYTYTELSDPLRVRVNPDGTVDTIAEENVFTLRFGLYF